MKPAPTYCFGNLYLFASLTLTGLAMGCSSSKQAGEAKPASAGRPISTWQGQPLNIDGSDSDWARPLPYYVAEEKLAYDVSNDETNLYIRWSTRDPQEQSKILNGGLTVWINKNGEPASETSVGIGYPLDMSNNRDRQLMAQARPDLYKDKPVTLEDQKDYGLFGFSENPDNYEYGQPNPEGVVVKAEYNRSGALIYEAMMPLRVLFPKTDPRYYSGHNIAVGFFVEGIPPQPGRRGGGGGGGSGLGVGVGGGLGFGGFGGGGAGLGLSIGTGLGRSGGRGKDPQTKPGKIWQVVTVARQPV